MRDTFSIYLNGKCEATTFHSFSAAKHTARIYLSTPGLPLHSSCLIVCDQTSAVRCIVIDDANGISFIDVDQYNVFSGYATSHHPTPAT